MLAMSNKHIAVIWLFEVILFLIAGTSATYFLDFPPAQSDTLLYCQGARRIVEGAPFSFSYGEAVTTGTTSVLYPFILALPYALGAHGSSLLAVGFFLNALFLLVFFWGWKKTFEIWIDDPPARLVATMLVVLSGQAVFCALAQSDIGIWMALSALLAYGMASNKSCIYGTVLFLSPWFRPEGMACILAFGLAIVLRKLLLKEVSRKDCFLFFCCILSALGVFALNYCLTGECQFSSVANKGYLKKYSFWIAVPMIAKDSVAILKGLVLGMSDSYPRVIHVFPLLGGGLFAIGALANRWDSKTIVRKCPWLFLAAGSCFVIANSGYQNTNVDRYLVWMMPIVAMFVAEGVVAVNRHHGKCAYWILAVVLLAFSACSNMTLACTYHQVCRSSQIRRLFTAECERVIPKGASIGTHASGGIAYDFSSRTVKTLSGIYSPEFHHKRAAISCFEVLKNNSASRFDYWFVEENSYLPMSPDNRDVMMGEVVLSGPRGFELRRANWRAYDNSLVNLCDVPSDMQLVDQVIVGDEMSENAADYEVIDRYGRDAVEPILEIFNSGSNSVFEVSRIVLGGTRMSVPLQEGKDAVIVLRVKRSVSAENGSQYHFSDVMRFNLEIDGNIVGEREMPLSSEGFTDGTVIIPGDIIKNSPTRVGILGDHLSCRYRFYQ